MPTATPFHADDDRNNGWREPTAERIFSARAPPSSVAPETGIVLPHPARIDRVQGVIPDVRIGIPRLRIDRIRSHIAGIGTGESSLRSVEVSRLEEIETCFVVAFLAREFFIDGIAEGSPLGLAASRVRPNLFAERQIVVARDDVCGAVGHHAH